MQFSELIRMRQSCRSFELSRPVEEEKLNLCIEAAKMAPSAVNAQPYDIWVVREKVKEIRDAKASFNKFVDSCPLFVVFTDAPYGHELCEEASRKMGIDYRTQDIGESIAYFTLQAAELGLGTCILGSFVPEAVRALLGADARVQTIIAVGYPVDGYTIRKKTRKEVSENVHFI